jgi:hypothetical protein
MATSPSDSHPGEKPRALAPSMKARRAIFDEAEPSTSPGSGALAKPFAQHLRDTPPAPMPMAVVATLYVAGALVGLLLLASLLRLMQPRKEAPDGATGRLPVMTTGRHLA